MFRSLDHEVRAAEARPGAAPARGGGADRANPGRPDLEFGRMTAPGEPRGPEGRRRRLGQTAVTASNGQQRVRRKKK